MLTTGVSCALGAAVYSRCFGNGAILGNFKSTNWPFGKQNKVRINIWGILHDFRIFFIGKGSFCLTLRKARKIPASYCNKVKQQCINLVIISFRLFQYIYGPGGSMSQVVGYLTTHISLSPIRRGFAPDFVNYKKGCT